VDVQLVKTVNKSLAASSNLGEPYCTGDIIATTSDDAEVFPDWVLQMKRLHFEHPEAGGIGGSISGANQDSLVSRASDLYTFASPARAKYVATWPGVNMSYKRAAVERARPHDESFSRGEEVDYNWRVKQLGYQIYYDPAPRVRHHHRATLRGLWYQFFMYGRGYYLVRRKWPQMHCIYPHSLSSPRALFKLLNFVLTLSYNPIQFAWRSPRFTDRIAAVPIIFMAMLAWRLGVLRQKFNRDVDPVAFQRAANHL
jgi:GT2 family glycosyltransferase